VAGDVGSDRDHLFGCWVDRNSGKESYLSSDESPRTLLGDSPELSVKSRGRMG
jgi:hypothetical protein